MASAAEDRAARAARSGTAVGAAVLVALAAHLAGGGAAPAPALVVAVLALAWPAGLLLVGRRPGLLRRAAVVGVAQAMLHGVFALGGAAPAGAAQGWAGMRGMPGMSGTAGTHGLVLPTAAAAAPMPHDGAMPWTHLLAGAVTVAAWRWGGAVLARLLTEVAVRRVLALLAPLDPAAPAARAPHGRTRLPVPVPLLAAHRDRGPPCPA